MTESAKEALTLLNAHYVRAVEQADVDWFDEHLAAEFYNSNADGTLVDRPHFLAQIARGSNVTELRPQDVIIRLFAAHAIIHARTTYRKADGTPGAGRYTDDWHLIGDRWLCVSAHVTRA